MFEHMRPGHSSSEAGKHKHLTQEVRKMMSALTHKVSELHKNGSIDHHEEDEHGMRMITLAGTNTGVTMHGNLNGEDGGDDDGISGEQEKLSTFVNSNFQGINNSLMLGGSYSTNDPGVHLDIADIYEHQIGGKKKDKKHKSEDDSEESD